MASIWRIEMLGGLRVIGRDREITRFRTQKTACLLAFLACHLERTHPREVLCEVLWPESDPDLSRQNLRQALSSLRHQLEPPGIPEGSILVTDRFSARLNPAGVSTDVEAFRKLLHQAERVDSARERREALRQAVGLYRGELLPGFYEGWVIREQDALFQDYTKAVGVLVQMLEAGGALAEAYAVLQQALSLYPGAAALNSLAGRLGPPPDAPADNAPRMAIEDVPSPAREVVEEIIVSRPVGTPDPPASSLPPSLTRFFGREGEIADLRRHLERGERLVTLTGPGGTGKTRLALETARTLEAGFAGAVWFVPLAGLSDPGQVPDTIRSAMALPSAPDTDPLEQVAFVLANRPALLVLDNFEHLVDGGAETVQRLLLRIPTLSLLVTSRRLLSLTAEQAFPVPPLPVPRDLLEPQRLLQCRSVQLFMDRAQAVRPDFQVTANNSETLACLCVRLEGIPLALELAAARSAMFPPARMLSELEHRFDVLVSRKRDADPRHQTLKAAIDWSFHLLAPDLRGIFRRLSVFRGGWTEEGASFVCGVADILPHLEGLVENSLVLVEETEQGNRFHMLETLREYGWEQMDASERWELRKRHRDWVFHFAEGAGPGSRGPKHLEWFARLDSEHENVRAALAFCQEDPDGAEAGMFIVGALSWFWAWRGRFSEVRDLLQAAGEHPGVRPATQAWAMKYVANISLGWSEPYTTDWSIETIEQTVSVLRRTGPAWALVEVLIGLTTMNGNLTTPKSMQEEALLLARENNLDVFVLFVLLQKEGLDIVDDVLEYVQKTGSHEMHFDMLMMLVWNVTEQGDGLRAWSLFDEVRSLCKKIENPHRRAIAHLQIGVFLNENGDYDGAEISFKEAEAVSRSVGDIRQLGWSLGSLATLAREVGDYATARSYYEEQKALLERYGLPLNGVLHNLGRLTATEGDVAAGRALLLQALVLNRAAGYAPYEANNLLVLGCIARREGELTESRRLLSECLVIWARTGPRHWIAYALEAFACLCVAEGAPARAVRLYGAAEALRQAIRKAMQPEDWPEHEAAIAAARAALGEEAYASAWADGQAISVEQAIDDALGGAGAPSSDL